MASVFPQRLLVMSVGYVLPHTKINVVLCQSAKFRPNGKLYDGVGIQPDVEMEATPQDIVGSSDRVLDAAVRRLKDAPYRND